MPCWGARYSVSPQVQTPEPHGVGAGEGGFLILPGHTFLVLLIKATHKWLGKHLQSAAMWEVHETEQTHSHHHHPLSPRRTGWKTEAWTTVFPMINLTVSL